MMDSERILETLQTQVEAWECGAGVYAQGGEMKIDGDISRVPPDLANRIINHREDFIRLYCEPDNRRLLRSWFGEKGTPTSSTVEPWNQVLSTLRHLVSRAGSQFSHLLEYIQEDEYVVTGIDMPLEPDLRRGARDLADELLDPAHPYSLADFADDLLLRWRELDLDERLACALVWIEADPSANHLVSSRLPPAATAA